MAVSPALVQAFSVELDKLAEFRAGDVLVLSPQQTSGTGSKLKSAIARFVGKKNSQVQGTYTHSAIVTGPRDLVESRYETGVVRRDIKDALSGKDYIQLRPTVSKERIRDAVRFAEEQVGKEYDRGGMYRASVGVFLPQKLTERLAARKKDERAGEKWTCSSIVSAAYGKNITPVGSSLSAPADFLHTRNFREVSKKNVTGQSEQKSLVGRFRGRK